MANTIHTETEQKKKGQWFTPVEIVEKMINFTNLDWLGNIYEPTAGDGNIVMKIIDKKISLGMTPQEAIDTTYANEFDTPVYDVLTAHLKSYCDEHKIIYREDNITNQDACVCKPGCDKYEIITNLPFGSWANSNLPRQIINNYSNIRAVYLTKWTTGCYKKYVPHVKKFENVVFPGIVYDTLLWEYDPEYTEGDIWIYWPLPKLPKHKLNKNRNYLRNNMKVMLGMTTSGNNSLYTVKPWNESYDKESGMKKCIYLSEDEMNRLIELRFGDESSMKYKKHIHPKRAMYYQDAIFDYLYHNGFDYLFEE